MLRKELLAILKSVAPTLDSHAVIPVLSHLCFTNKQVYAYNNVTCLRAPCNLNIEGAVPGAVLLSVLEQSRAAEIVCEASRNEALFRSGKKTINLRLAVLPTTDFLFKAPIQEGVEVKFAAEFQAALRLVAKVASEETADPALSGVTLSFGKKSLTFYATDTRAMAKVTIALSAPKMAGKSLILSKEFYTQLLKMSGKVIVIFTDSGDLIAVGKDLELFGRVVQNARPEMFENTFKDNALDNIPQTDIPESMNLMLQRAVSVNPEMTSFTYENGKLYLLTKGLGSELRDKVSVGLGKKPLSAATSTKSLLKHWDDASRFGIGESCILMRGDGWVSIVAVLGKADEN